MIHISAMKARFAALLPAAALLLTGANAVTLDGSRPPANQPTLTLVVVDNLRLKFGFNRMDLAFQSVAKQRKWPVTIAAERLTANTQEHPLELRIFFQGINEFITGEYTLRAWMTLSVRGVKHDLGIVSYRYFVRQWEDDNDMYDKIFRGAANVAADKIEPLIFTRVPGRPLSPRDAADGNQ